MQQEAIPILSAVTTPRHSTKERKSPSIDQWRGFLIFGACRQSWPTKDRHAVIILQQQLQQQCRKEKMVQRFHLLVLCPAQNVQVPPEFDFRDHTVWSCRDGTAVVMAISEAITAT